MSTKLTILVLLYLSLPCWCGIFPEQKWVAVLWGGEVQAQNKPGADSTEKVSFWQQFKSVLAKSKSNDDTPLSVTEKFPLYYDWIHQKDQKFYDSLTKLGIANWDRYQNIITVDIKRDKDTSLVNKLSRKYKVFGWHPYWMGSAYKSYHFDYLSHLAWFSYNIEPSTGNYNNPDVIDIWRNSQELFELAKAKGCKVLLTITNHSRSGNTTFLKNEKNQQDVLIDSLISLLQGRGDGVDVNFEMIGDGLERELTLFLQKLSTRLKGKIVSVDLPILDNNKSYLFNELDNVDLFIVTGYDYFNRRSEIDGPVAPLDLLGKQLSIQTSVANYLQAGLKREKLLLGLPYYGAIWTAQSLNPQDKTRKFNRHITYRELKARYANVPPSYDIDRWGAYHFTFNQDSNYYEKCWFDDPLTLGRKFDWVKKEQLAGVGIWALGYDNGHEDMWDLIKNKLVADSVLTFSEPYIESRQYKLGRSLLEYRKVIAIAGIFMVVFIIGGMVVALFDWRVREVFFQNKTLRLLYSIAAIAIILSIFAFYLFVSDQALLNNNNLFALGIGLTLGVVIALTIGFFHEKQRDSLP